MLHRQSVYYDTDIGDMTIKIVKGWEKNDFIKLKALRYFAVELRRISWVKWKRQENEGFETDGFLCHDGVTLTQEYLYDVLVQVVREVTFGFSEITNYFRVEFTNRISLIPVRTQRANRRREREELGDIRTRGIPSGNLSDVVSFQSNPTWESRHPPSYVLPINDRASFSGRDPGYAPSTLGFHERRLPREPDRRAINPLLQVRDRDRTPIRVCTTADDDLEDPPPVTTYGGWRSLRETSPFNVSVSSFSPVSPLPEGQNASVLSDEIMSKLLEMSTKLNNFEKEKKEEQKKRKNLEDKFSIFKEEAQHREKVLSKELEKVKKQGKEKESER
ncbi:unnamed protein product [Rotaria socialis]|nr:unnamed protein product [Rotaria socialis]